VLQSAFDADRRLCHLDDAAGDRGRGAAQASRPARTTGSAELNGRNDFSLAGTFEGEFSDATRSDTGKGAKRNQW